MKTVSKILCAVSGALAICFFIFLIADAAYYDPMANSAPFYAFVVIRGIEFLLPSAVILIVAKIIKSR